MFAYSSIVRLKLCTGSLTSPRLNCAREYAAEMERLSLAVNLYRYFIEYIYFERDSNSLRVIL